MYTGYFAQCKKYINNGLIPVSITRVNPHWFTGYHYQILAPSYELLQDYKFNGLSTTEYTYYYNNYLNTLSYIKVLSDLTRFGDLDKIVLCCYERSTDFCHRHLVSKWLSNYINIGEYHV